MGKHLRNKEFKKTKPRQEAPMPINISTDREKPVFSFHSLQRNYCISDCNKDEKAALADRLRELSNLTWIDLKQAPKHGCGCEKINTTAINEPIPKCITEDVIFLAFRFDAKKPMVGYRDQATFHILWLDTKFKLYDHGT